MIVFGEIGLAGECRSVTNTIQRVNEAVRLGFKKIAIPYRSIKAISNIKDVEIKPLRSVFDLIKLLD